TTTQTLRGLPPTGMFHWRADRVNLEAFNGAFVGLMGRTSSLADSEMAAFDDFVLPLVHPPNPNQFLDRTLPGDPGPSPVPSAKRGRSFFLNVRVDGNILACNNCHASEAFGPGTNGQIIDHTALQEAQDMKVPELRNLYRKTGFRGQPRGWVYVGGGMWRSDKQAESDIATASLRALGGLGTELTVTGVPKGSGTRLGIDQDRDGYRDGDELDAGSNPANPSSTPANVAVEPATPREEFALRSIKPNPFRTDLEVAFTLGRPGPVDLVVYDVLGREVRAVARGTRLTAGPQSLRWDGRDANGREAGAGVYFVRLRTER